MNIAAIVLAAVATAAPAPPANATFAGVTLGESATALVAQLGEPAGVADKGDMVGLVTYIYLARDGSAMEDVMLVDGNVMSVTVLPPAGREAPAAVGATPAATALGTWYGGPASSIPSGAQPLSGPDGLLYRIGATGGVIDYMSAELPEATLRALPVAPKATLHGGLSPADAIVIVAPTEGVGVRFEYVYLALSHCGGSGHWHSTGQALLNQNGRDYDRLDAQCTVGGAKRSFFFDISSYFGKL